jgi:hypothetical protein
MPPAALDELRARLSKDAVKTALLDEVVAAIEEEDVQGKYLETVDYEEALDQADMAIVGGKKRTAACKAAATAALSVAQHAAPKASASSKVAAAPMKAPAAPVVPAAPIVPAAPKTQPAEGAASATLWESLGSFHSSLLDYAKIRAYFIEGDLWDDRGRAICKATIGSELMSTLRLEPSDPSGGFVACLVPTFYSGVVEALLAGLLDMSAVTAVIGVLIAYLVSALMYLVVVKNADLVASAPATIDVFNEDCKFSPKERLQYAAIGLALLLVFDLMLAFQLRASLLTTPFYIVKAILAGLMLIHTHKLSSKLESATSNAALFMA